MRSDMASKDFLKLFGKTEDFFKDSVSLRTRYYTVVVVYHDGYKKEYCCIEKPHSYIMQVKKNPKVKTAYIKE
jgi:hypothetical protein